MNNDGHSISSVPAHLVGVSPEVVKASRWLIAFELLAGIATVAVLVFVLKMDTSNLVAWSLLFVTLPEILSDLGRLAQPPNVAVGGGSIAYRGPSDSWSSPADNVADIRRLDDRLQVTFFDPKQILPETLHPSLEETRRAAGAHLDLSGPFSRQAVDCLLELLPSTAKGAQEVDPRLLPLTRPLVVIPAIIVLNVALFAAMVLTSGSLETLLTPDRSDLAAWGAQIGTLALSSQPWQLFTATVVHFNIIHLLLNMWVLLKIGGMAERLLGRPGFIVVYLLAGLIGSLAAAIGSPGRFGCGASGAVLGTLGALLTYGWCQGKTLLPGVANQLKFGVLLIVILTFGFDASVPFISQTAHIGGFIAGVVVALPLARPIEESSFLGQLMRSLTVLAAGLALIVMTLPYAATRVEGTVGWVRGALTAFNHIEDRVRKRARGMNDAEREGVSMHIFIAQEILPRWKEIRGLIEEPEVASHAPEAAEVRRQARIYADSTQEMLECFLPEFQVLYLAPMLCRDAEVSRRDAEAELEKLLKVHR